MWNNFQLLSVAEITGNYFIHVTSYCNMIYLNKSLSVDLVSTFKIVNLMLKSSNSVELLIIYNDWVISEKRKKEKKSSTKIFVVVVSLFFFFVVVVFLKKQRYLCCDWNLLCLVRIHPLWFFFSIWVFFHEHSRFTGQQGKGEAISSSPLYHFHLLHKQLEVSRAITAESSLSGVWWFCFVWYIIK